MHQWEIAIGGKAVVLTAEEGANGKLFVRRNGRIVTPPIAPAEDERVFTIDGEELRLQRDGDAITLAVIPREEFVAPPVEEAPPADPFPIDAPFELPREVPLERESFLDSLIQRYEPPPSVVVRGRVYFGVTLLLFLLTLMSATRLHVMHQNATSMYNRPLLGDDRGGDERMFARMQSAQRLMMAALTFISLLAFVGMIAGGMLARGFIVAPRLIEGVTWLMLLIYGLTLLRVDRLAHTQLHAFLEPVHAATVISMLHRSSFISFAVFALGAGGLLHMAGSRSIERLYDEDAF